jgi:hypothetical protein
MEYVRIAVNGFVSTSVYMYVCISPSVHAYIFFSAARMQKGKKIKHAAFLTRDHKCGGYQNKTPNAKLRSMQEREKPSTGPHSDAFYISMLPLPTAALSFGVWLAELNFLPTAAGTLAS